MVRKTENTEARRADVAARIRRLRTARGWRQAELARQAALHMPEGNFGRSLVSKYENAEVLPSVVNVAAMAKALGVSPEEVMPSNPAISEAMPLGVKADATVVDSDTVHVRVNQRLPAALGYKILMMIHEHEAEERKK